MIAESILREVQHRANMRNGEIVERMFGRSKYSTLWHMHRLWINDEISHIREEQLLFERERQLFAEQVHMQFCDDCFREIGHCICK